MFKRQSITSKLTLLMVLASGVSLLVSCVAFVYHDLAMFRIAKVRQLSALAEVLGTTSTAAILFRQTKSAEELLSSLRHSPTVVHAALYDEKGTLFARYDRGDHQGFQPPRVAPATGYRFTPDNYLDVTVALTEGQERLGTIYLHATLNDLAGEFYEYVRIAAIVMLVALLVATGLSVTLQRVVSVPLLRLATAAQRISNEGDYSIRVETRSNDELGVLYEEFNRMLDRVQVADVALRGAHAELREANDQLEQRVASRTEQLSDANEQLTREMAENQRTNHELKRSENRLRAIVENASDGILTLGEHGVIESFNPAAERIFVLLAEEAIGQHIRGVLPAFHAEDWQRWLAESGPSRNGVDGERREVTGQRRLGPTFPAELTVSELLLGDRRRFTVFVRDLTERKRAEQQLAQVQSQLLETSRRAGMADVANSVLHNVGNVLNSVNVSASLVWERVRNYRLAGLSKAVVLIRENAARLDQFFTQDDRGRQLPDYLAQLADHLSQEQQGILRELNSLVTNIDHIKDIVRAQQTYAGVSGVVEACQLDSLLEDAWQFSRGSFEQHGIRVVREYEPVPAVYVEKSKLLQILVNLIKNAKEAMVASQQPDRALTLRLKQADNRVRLEVADNGLGISPENLKTIFSHGFTTKKNGHGFGLHSSANAATEMNGSLAVTSDGAGQGATFVIELPFQPGTA